MEQWPKLGITVKDIEDWAIIRSQPNGMRDFLRSRDLDIENVLGAVKVFDLHINPDSFRVWKSAAEQAAILKANGFEAIYDPVNTPISVREQLLEDIGPDADGTFVFEPSRLYLAYTSESVIIPPTESWRMRTYFLRKDTRDTLALTTNVSAPILKPNSRGPQTYEIINETSIPLIIRIQNLVCPTAVFVHEEVAENTGGTFQLQTGTKPKLGTINLR